MNDPQVVALIYTIEHGNSVSYENAGPLHYSDSPEFDLTVEDNIAQFELKTHYADEDEALAAIEPFIRAWEFMSEMRGGPGSFRLRYTNAKIIDRNPPPPEPSVKDLDIRASAHLGGTFSAKAEITVLKAHYPPPPAGGSVNPDDPHVVKMKRRFEEYRLRRAKLPDTAYYCVTELEDKYGGRKNAARECGISKQVLGKIGDLTSNKGGGNARKAKGSDKEYTDQERRFLEKAVTEIIFRVAQVAADGSQRSPQITMGDLPSL